MRSNSAFCNLFIFLFTFVIVFILILIPRIPFFAISFIIIPHYVSLSSSGKGMNFHFQFSIAIADGRAWQDGNGMDNG